MTGLRYETFKLDRQNYAASSPIGSLASLCSPIVALAALVHRKGILLKDQLFLLNPGFKDDAGDGPFYCGDSVPVEGLLSFFPALREEIDVRYVRVGASAKTRANSIQVQNHCT